MTDPLLREMERQLAEAEAKDKAREAKFNPRVGTDPETGGLTVDIDLPDNHSMEDLIEGMQAAARKAGLT